MAWADVLRAAAGAVGVGERTPSLIAYVEAFVRWNQRINLSAARTPDDVADHVVDCLALIPHLAPGARVVDVGSGGGLPGIVLAAGRPDLHVTCVEPIHKKAAFLRQAARDLGLAVTVMTQRVESVEGNFDVAVSRATFELVTWLERGMALVVPGGLVIGMEGLERAALPPGAVRHPYSIRDRTRALVIRPVPPGG